MELTWIPLSERKPTKADADIFGCVLYFDQLNGVQVSGYKNWYQLNRLFVTHFAPLVDCEPPEARDTRGDMVIRPYSHRPHDGRESYHVPKQLEG